MTMRAGRARRGAARAGRGAAARPARAGGKKRRRYVCVRTRRIEINVLFITHEMTTACRARGYRVQPSQGVMIATPLGGAPRHDCGRRRMCAAPPNQDP